MKFQVGDRVVHPVYGVGTIRSLGRQQFSGAPARQYYEVKTGGPTVWVPIDEHGATVLRAIAAKESLDACRKILKSRPVRFEKDRQLRQADLTRRLGVKSLPSLCETVRDLRADGELKPLGKADDDLLKRISKAMCDEWAAAEGVTFQVAQDEIESLLAQAQGRRSTRERLQ